MLRLEKKHWRLVRAKLASEEVKEKRQLRNFWIFEKGKREKTGPRKGEVMGQKIQWRKRSEFGCIWKKASRIQLMVENIKIRYIFK